MANYGGIACSEDVRRSLKVLEELRLNGIDYIEISAQDTDSQRSIHVHFIRNFSEDNYLASLVKRPELFTISGGVIIRDIKVLSVYQAQGHLVVEVDRAGDFSIYRLKIKSDHLDPAHSQCDFSFKEGCKSFIDPKAEGKYPPKLHHGPLVDYMAKDYASFRKALIDLIPTLIPDWKEQHEADLGIMLLELLAYAGDQLSYFQDSVANEAYLETARQRISVRRHARQIDYRMHDGASARAFVFFCVDNEEVTLPEGTQVLTRINTPLGTSSSRPGAVIPYTEREDALAYADVVFETFKTTKLRRRLNEIKIHNWGNGNCYLPEGATSADLVGYLGDMLHPGDFLLLEEVKSPDIGNPEDCDPSHRQIVRLTKVESKGIYDPLFNLKGGPRKKLKDPLMPITRVSWDRADRLTFSLCVSSINEKGEHIEEVSVARGNLVLADHGLRVKEEGLPLPITPAYESQRRAHRIRLRYGPLSFRMDADLEDRSVKNMLNVDPRRAKPQVLDLRVNTSPPSQWMAAPESSLLNSSQFDAHYVVETDNSGRAVIRFGNGENGKALPEITPSDDENETTKQKDIIDVTYRVGVGVSGNVGPDSLAHIIDNEIGIGIEPMERRDKKWPIANPLPAWGGVDPEPTEIVKKVASASFHAEQFRAVTEADYAEAAMKDPAVDKAVATFRWTGSWHTVFISIDPFGTNDVPDELKKRLKEKLEGQYALAGYDVEIEDPAYVPLEIDLDICVSKDHFQSHVEKAVLEALSNRELTDGSVGFFYPDRFTFGEPLYLSEIYSAIQKVKGVDSALITKFNRLGKSVNGDINNGVIRVGQREVIRLDNDQILPGNGILRLNMRGGK